MNENDLQLLRQYCRDRDEDAFAEIVRRHLGLVRSAALRQVHSSQLAEEVAQSVRRRASGGKLVGFRPAIHCSTRCGRQKMRTYQYLRIHRTQRVGGGFSMSDGEGVGALMNIDLNPQLSPDGLSGACT